MAQALGGATDVESFRAIVTEIATNPADRDALKQILSDYVQKTEKEPAEQERNRVEAAWDVLMVPTAETGARYAEAVRAQVPEADMTKANEAWNTLSTSTDPAAREQAGTTLVDLERAHPGFIASESFRLTGGRSSGPQPSGAT